MNRRLKILIKNMGANVKPNSVKIAGRCVGVVHNICKSFEDQTTACIDSDHHPYPEFGRDYSNVVGVLEEEKVFTPLSKRKHHYFSFTCGLMERR